MDRADTSFQMDVCLFKKDGTAFPILNSIFGLPEDEQLIYLNVIFYRIEPEDLKPQKQLMAKSIEQGFRAESRKPIITISSSLKEGKTRLSFEDNSTGIREADQSKVFMIFKRFHQQIAGRGIGMYLVKRIVDLNNSKVELYSKENTGTAFRFQFPGA